MLENLELTNIDVRFYLSVFY